MPIHTAFITNVLPAPANSGTPIRAVRLASALRSLGPVSLYCRASQADLESLSDHADLRVFTRVRTDTYPSEVFTRFSRVFTSQSMDHWMSFDDPLSFMLAQDHRERPFDVAVCQQIFTSNVAWAIPDVPVVLDEHNIESQALAQLIAASARIQPGIDPARIPALREYEDLVWSRAALITCTSESDAGQIRARSQTRVLVIPNGAPTAELRFIPPSQRLEKEILFVGGFFWPPNSKAGRFLIKDVLPRVREAEPGARLVLCGKEPGMELTLLRRTGVEVTGTVPSVTPYLERAGVFANALFEGTGSSLKVLEALSAGVPLVSTSIGVRGHPVEPGRHYIPAEDADTFARAIIEIFQAPERFDELARAGRSLAESLAWERVGESFAAEVAAAAHARPQSSS